MSKEENEEELTNKITLYDEEQNPTDFELLDIVDLDDEQYVVLLPAEQTDDNEGEVVILKIEDTEGDEESYVSVEDEDLLNRVFETFKEKFKDEFNFEDEE